jgi:hypothetical protein
MPSGRERTVWRTTAALAASAWLVSNATAGARDHAEHAARVDKVFAAYDRSDSPGCTVGVIADGAFVHVRGYGRANLEHGVPLGPRTVFDIGSTSKQFSAAAVVLLAQDGRLSLDDDVRKHVSEMPDYGRPVTIRHLLTHTSGLRDYLGLMGLAGHYRERASGQTRRVRFEDGTLRVETFGGAYELAPVESRRFRMVGGPPTLRVVFETDGGSPRMREEDAARSPTVWEPFAPVRPSAAELAAYAGRYLSVELDTTYAVEVTDDGLVLKGRRVGGALAPTVRDEFTQGPRVLRFERDAGGRPSAFRLGQGRIRNLRFTRSDAP